MSCITVVADGATKTSRSCRINWQGGAVPWPASSIQMACGKHKQPSPNKSVCVRPQMPRLHVALQPGQGAARGLRPTENRVACEASRRLRRSCPSSSGRGRPLQLQAGAAGRPRGIQKCMLASCTKYVTRCSQPATMLGASVRGNCVLIHAPPRGTAQLHHLA